MTQIELLDTIRAEIKRLQEMYLVNQDKFKVDDTDLSIFYEGKAKMCGEVLSFLDTLQEQERPEPYNPTYDEAYLNEKIKKATESWKGVDVNKMLAECRGYDEPEVDLENEIERFLASEESTTYVSSGKFTTSYKDPKKIARHFAEWGAKNAK